jgi:adenosine deaminase
VVADEALAELHVHLEGTVRYETATALGLAHGLPPPPEYRYSSLDGFMKVYVPLKRYLVTGGDFERVIVEHGETMSRQRITYAEVSFNPSLHAGDDWLDGVARGRRRVSDELGVELMWLVELVRGADTSVNERSLEIALSTEGVVGLGLVGDETISASPLIPLVERGRKAGLGFMPHAGQSGGPEVVREAIGPMGASRVAHGVSAARDAALLQELADRDICLCVCPSSNARIGLKPDFRAIADAGVPLTINTDDPAMVPATLRGELDLAVDRYGLVRENLIAAAWKHRFPAP